MAFNNSTGVNASDSTFNEIHHGGTQINYHFSRREPTVYFVFQEVRGIISWKNSIYRHLASSPSDGQSPDDPVTLASSALRSPTPPEKIIPNTPTNENRAVLPESSNEHEISAQVDPNEADEMVERIGEEVCFILL